MLLLSGYGFSYLSAGVERNKEVVIMNAIIIILFVIFLCYRTPSDAFIKGCLILFGISVVMCFAICSEDYKSIKEMEDIIKAREERKRKREKRGGDKKNDRT